MYRDLLWLGEWYDVQRVIFMNKNCTKRAELLFLLLLLQGSGGRQGGAPCFDSRRPRIPRSRRSAKIPERHERPHRPSPRTAIFEREIRRLSMFGAIDTKSRKLKEIVRKKSLDQFIWQIGFVENYHVIGSVFFLGRYSDWYENLDGEIIGGRRSIRWVMASFRF